MLGSGGMMPMPHRRLTSIAIRTKGWVYLFDCGEGTQVPYKEHHLGQRALRCIAISHLHADHCLGLPGMLMLRAQMPNPEPLYILGPPGLERFIHNIRKDLALYINYEIKVLERPLLSTHDVPKVHPPPMTEVLQSKKNAVSALAAEEARSSLAFEDEEVKIFWAPLDHTTFCLGYRLEEHQRPGKFDPQAALDLQVPRGPLWGRLQRGCAVHSSEGKLVQPADVMGPPRRGRSIAFVTDTAPTPSIKTLLDHVDMAFIESMFLSIHLEDAKSKKHLTACQAAQYVQDAKASRAVFVHISPRYEDSQLKLFKREVRAIHPRIQVARDGAQYDIPLEDF